MSKITCFLICDPTTMTLLGGVRDSPAAQNSAKIDGFARYTIDEHNKKQDKKIKKVAQTAGSKVAAGSKSKATGGNTRATGSQEMVDQEIMQQVEDKVLGIHKIPTRPPSQPRGPSLIKETACSDGGGLQLLSTGRGRLLLLQSPCSIKLSQR